MTKLRVSPMEQKIHEKNNKLSDAEFEKKYPAFHCATDPWFQKLVAANAKRKAEAEAKLKKEEAKCKPKTGQSSKEKKKKE